MTSSIAVMHLGLGLVIDLPEDTATFDLPAAYDASWEGRPDLEYSRPLTGRASGEEFLVQSGWSSTTPRGDMVLCTIEPHGISA